MALPDKGEQDWQQEMLQKRHLRPYEAYISVDAQALAFVQAAKHRGGEKLKQLRVD